MNGWAEYEIGRQHREEIRHEAAVTRVEKLARASRETSPYVVRDLSWELARHLDTEIFSATASATPIAQGRCASTREQKRLTTNPTADFDPDWQPLVH